MDFNIPIDELLSLGGATILVTALTEVIIRALAWSPNTQGRFGPLLAIGVGVVVVGLAAVSQNSDLPRAVVTGIEAGLAAMGVQNLVTSPPVKSLVGQE